MNLKTQIRIFIIEDNKVFAHALKADIETAFVNMSIKIFSFETGEECMQKFEEEKPQIVILDYHLNSRNPEAVDGIKVLDWIKKINNDTNVIMLTGDDHIDIALKSFKHGACDYIVKTDTQFRKIIYTLFNLFRIMEAKSEMRKYKYLAVGLFLCVVFILSWMITGQIYNRSLFILW